MIQFANGITVSAPGRVCLFGEHQDYLGLPIIAGAISKRIKVEGNHISDRVIHIMLPDIKSEEIIDLDEPIVYKNTRDYFKSALIILLRNGFTFSRGIECVVHGDIPINAGASSSSALVVAWVKFCALMSDQIEDLRDDQTAKFAYEAEVVEFEEPGGMMDHYSTALGDTIFLDPRPGIHLEKLHPKFGNFVLGNSLEPKDTKGILSRVKNGVLDTVASLQKLHQGFDLRTISLNELDEVKKDVSEEQYNLLEGTIINRDICRQAHDLLLRPTLDHHLFGNLLTRHHEVLKNVQKISTDRIDRMLSAALEAGAYGGKINGSGGGGCMFAYAPDNAESVAEAIESQGGKADIITLSPGVSLDKRNKQ